MNSRKEQIRVPLTYKELLDIEQAAMDAGYKRMRNGRPAGNLSKFLRDLGTGAITYSGRKRAGS